MTKLKSTKLVKSVGIPGIIISLFFIVLLIASVFLGHNFLATISMVIHRWGMYAILVLALVPGIQSGIGLNFGMSLGIISGLLGTVLSVELKLAAHPAFANSKGTAAFLSFLIALVLGILISTIVGWLYGLLLNRLKGSEMTVSTYVGFSAIAFMNIIWLTLPLKNGDAIWPVGGEGLRNTVNLEGYFAFILNDFLGFHIGGVKELADGSIISNVFSFAKSADIKNSLYIPTGVILFVLLACAVVWLFLRTKTGTALSAAGANPDYAKSSGINYDKTRILGTILSTVLASVGIIVYSQSYGFIQLYNAPLMMSFLCVAAILIGGASIRRSKVINVIIGTFLFQGVLAVSLPVANSLMPNTNIPDILRQIISNGIILYALAVAGGGRSNE